MPKAAHIGAGEFRGDARFQAAHQNQPAIVAVGRGLRLVRRASTAKFIMASALNPKTVPVKLFGAIPAIVNGVVPTVTVSPTMWIRSPAFPAGIGQHYSAACCSPRPAKTGGRGTAEFP